MAEPAMISSMNSVNSTHPKLDKAIATLRQRGHKVETSPAGLVDNQPCITVDGVFRKYSEVFKMVDFKSS